MENTAKKTISAGGVELQAAYREMEEETGLKKDSLTYVAPLGSYERPKIGKGGIGDDASESKEIRMFLFTAAATELRPTDPENPEARWVSAEEALDMLTHPKDKEFLK